jgi:hypothetical protein
MNLKIWLTSLNGAITFSSIAMLSFIGYTLLEFRYFLEQWIPGRKAATLEMLFVLAFVGGWQFALFSAYGGKRGGLVAAAILTLIPALITLFDLVLYSPIPYGWPLLQITVWITFFACLIGAAALLVQLR